MTLLEMFKNRFLKSEEKNPSANKIDKEQVMFDTSDDVDYLGLINAYIHDGIKGAFENDQYNIPSIETQVQKINNYRRIAMQPEVADGLEEIINEVTYSENMDEVIKCSTELDNEKLSEAIIDKFDKIIKLLDVDKTLYNIIWRTYVDGQMNFFIEYSKDPKKGIKAIKLIDPRYFIYDETTQTYKYLQKQTDMFDNSVTLSSTELEFSKEEIVRADFGIRSDKNIILGPLEKTFKTANQLRTLEDLLIPLRFTRSVSRRVFNVDVSDMPVKKAEEAMRKIQEQLRYKKFYDPDTGEVRNQNHITSIVEDYWFANRSGSRGTTVDLLDESGNLGELGDILHFYKKLYKSMGIPASRANLDGESPSYDFTGSSIDQDEIKFQNYISRVRKVYTNCIKEILKRELILTGVFSKVEEYNEYSDCIKIFFAGENAIWEKIKLQNFTDKMELFKNNTDVMGKFFPVEFIYKRIFKFSDDEIEELLKQIQEEKTNELMKEIYDSDGY